MQYAPTPTNLDQLRDTGVGLGRYGDDDPVCKRQDAVVNQVAGFPQNWHATDVRPDTVAAVIKDAENVDVACAHCATDQTLRSRGATDNDQVGGKSALAFQVAQHSTPAQMCAAERDGCCRGPSGEAERGECGVQEAAQSASPATRRQRSNQQTPKAPARPFLRTHGVCAGGDQQEKRQHRCTQPHCLGQWHDKTGGKRCEGQSDRVAELKQSRQARPRRAGASALHVVRAQGSTPTLRSCVVSWCNRAVRASIVRHSGCPCFSREAG